MLEQFLRERYRNQNPHHDRRIRVDDLSDSDVQLVFCDIFVTVNGGDRFELELDKMPHNAVVEELIKEYGGAIGGPYGSTAKVQLAVTDDQSVDQLAQAIRGILRDEAGYYDRNWKWICPRTAKSLERLASKMRAFVKFVRAEAKRAERSQLPRGRVRRAGWPGRT